jgi:exopolysaccharide biosynthesis polyprenyl glycosylphosphotransferase
LVRRAVPGLDALVDIHAAARHPLPILADGGVLLLAATLAGVGSLLSGLSWAAILIAACYAAQVYSDRDSIETQGVIWYAVKPVAPVVVVGFVAAACGLLTTATAGLLVGWSLGLLVGMRCLSWLGLVLLRRRGLALRRTLIIGTDEVAAHLWRRLVEFPEAGLVPVQMLDWSLVASSEVIEREIDRHQIAHVVLVARDSAELRFTGSLRGDDDRRIHFSVVPAFADLFVNPSTMTTVGSIPLLPLGQVMRLRGGYAGKRILDMLISGLMLLVASPLMIATAIAIKLDDGGPVFYRQSRVGLEGRTFHMIKFRSMRVGADALIAELAAQNASDGLLFKLDRDPRVTRVGRFIRRSSIDELPQLLNVLAGQMSMVGPRPLPVAPDQFDAWDNERHAALPGITGYWQISGGTALGYDEMVRLDLAYVRNAALTLDLRLIARTVPALLHRRGPA